MRKINRKRPTRHRDRRGVLLMVVLSMLALFLLLGTAFLVTSNFYRKGETEAAKKDRTSNSPSDLLERAMLQLLRDTNTPSSALRGHSLLRDVYGTDGFVARVFVPNGQTQLMAQYAGATLAFPLGSTQGQLIDLFMMDDGPGSPALPEAAHVIKLERAPDGMPVDHDPATANDYYNGCLLTMLEGPAAGRTTRIIDYRFVGTFPEPNTGNGLFPVWRIRVMVFSRADGEALNVGGSGLQELVSDAGTFTGHAFMVNGRPFNGTGAGFNRLAAAGTPRLNAVEVVELTPGSGEFIGMEMALTPNARYIDTTQAAHFLSGTNPFQVSMPPAAFQRLNPTPNAVLYPTAVGPGGMDESYDIADYQNMFLARMPLTPRATAGLVDNSGGVYELGSQAARDLIDSNNSMRIDSENSVLPSFHRPALVNYWYQRLHKAQWVIDEFSNPDERARAILNPYAVGDPGTNAVLDQIVALKRKIMMRPIPEDHPNFDGTNPASRAFDPNITTYGVNGQIRFPFWEAVGPWDVDNDNDGIADSIWVDLGDPVQKTENGRLFQAMYAFLVVDLDSRIDLNVHGTVDHFANTDFDPVERVVGNVGNLTGGDLQAQGIDPTRWSSNRMPVGMGWGPGDISLRSILSPVTFPYSGSYTRVFGDPTSDDYARLFMGRVPNDLLSDAIYGRYGTLWNSPSTPRPGRSLAWNNTTGVINPATRDARTPFDFVGYPVADQLRSIRRGIPQYTFPSSFGTSPDLRGKFAMGIDYSGQPVYEAVWEEIDPTDFTVGPALVPLVEDSPFETNVSTSARRGLPSAVNFDDDALFEVADMERILRSYDPEIGTAPSRLWDLVDTFDPNKSVLTIASNPNSPSPEELILAQALTQVARRQVTTITSEIPTPADVVPSYITELGPDGVPGNVGDDDNQDSDGNGNVAEDVVPFNVATGRGEIGWYAVQDSSNPSVGLLLTGASDDFASLTGKSVAEARLVDVLWYRIQKSRIERDIKPYNFNNPAAVAELNAISEQLLPPEVLAGYKMDLNRPFGDGRDNNGNGIVDEPIEAGEPYVDANTNGKWDVGEKFVDLDGDGKYYADKDEDGIIDRVDINNDGNFDASEQVVDNLWAAQLGAPALVDNAMGKDVTGRGDYIDANDNGRFDAGEVRSRWLRDDAHLARQLYARHLYVLMLLLTDEEYVAPYNPADPQVHRYLRLKAKDLETAGMTKPKSKLAAQRKYTCRQIAQWAANCVDFRDSDACMTPFEYDENPWDGWNCVDTNGTPNDPTDDTTFPLDGDPATNENHRQRVDWEKIVVDNITDGRKLLTIGATGNPDFTTRDNQLDTLDCTRNCVWGAERPELLITETAAWHDTRLEDLATNSSKGDNTTYDDAGPSKPQDDDLDQRLRPRGSFFVEVYNPSSADGQRPAELYRYHDGSLHAADTDNDGNPDATFEGVLLNRLSNVADSNGLRSPVWRLIVVEEHPEYRNPNGTDKGPLARDNARSHNLVNHLRDHRDALFATNGGFTPTDPDWDEMFYRPITASNGDRINWYMSEWQQERSDSRNDNADDPQGNASDFDRNLFFKPYPYVEREMYFNSGDYFTRGSTLAREFTDLDGGKMSRIFNAMKVRVPFRYVRMPGQKTGGVAGGGTETRALTFRFIASPRLARDRKDAEIAPVMPGRYAVIGSAGVRYTSYDDDVDGNPRFTTTMGRTRRGGAADPKSLARTDDDQHVSSLRNTRRIELIPSADPTRQQLIVGANGGKPGNGEADRHNELLRLNTVAKNVHNINVDADIETDSRVLPPTVVVPVDEMNISEPIYGYEVRQRELDDLESGSGDTGQVWKERNAKGEGAYADAGGRNERHYDTPFDVDKEFEEEGSVPNYRVVHLQRLADPTLPWNPPPGHHRSKGGGRRDQHEPQLPLNPYRTVDSASVDLTVFNGTSSNEKAEPAQAGRWFRSVERGARAAAAAGSPNAMPLRSLWSQEVASRADEWIASAPGRFRRTMMRDEVPEPIRTREGIVQNHFDMVLNHTLGFANEAFGDIYLRPESGLPAGHAAIDPTDVDRDDNDRTTIGVAAGAPRFDTAANLASTFPWFTWNNRPFVSGNELLQVPAASSSTMLRQYSTMNTATTAGDQTDVYNGGVFVPDGGGGLDGDKTNAARYKVATAHFGHLLNVFQSTPQPASIQANATGDLVVPTGSANFHRILDYVHTPSRFVGTDTLLNPTVFATNTTMNLNDPRQSLLAPFNRVPEYREPGKLNLNTMIGQRLPTSGRPQLWSDVYDGLMHRVRDGNVMNGNRLVTSGHFGPAWRDVVLSRRGYVDPVAGGAPNGIDRTEMVLHSDSPTFFANPFRSAEAADLVPLAVLINGNVSKGILPVNGGVDASFLRAHPFRPGDGYAWGSPGPNSDDDNNGLMNDTREAGPAGDVFGPTAASAVPLFSELSSTAAIDGTRNPGMCYMPLTRMDNLTTTRSGVFAVWVTVGYFEVTPAPRYATVEQKFLNQTGGDPARARGLYNRVYPQGYQLGKELGSETGDIDRQRGFYIIDRTRPVAFKPGEDVNVEDAILLRRRIE